MASRKLISNELVRNEHVRYDSGMQSTTSHSRRERPAKPALSREGIIATAVAVMRAQGLEHVTMRRLAAELDTGPASLYVYVRNTAELHAAVLDELLGLVGLAHHGASAHWVDSVVRVLESYTGILVEHPGLARSALVTRPSGPNYLALVEVLLTLLREGGIPDAQSAWGVDILLLFATSIALEHGTRRQAMDADEDEEALTHAMRQATASNYPTIAALGGDLLSGTPEARFGWHVRVLLNGMAMTPRPTLESEQEGLDVRDPGGLLGRSRPD
jgi:AcrR family transcriptional regulator